MPGEGIEPSKAENLKAFFAYFLKTQSRALGGLLPLEVITEPGGSC